MTREEIVNSREYSVTKAAIEYYNNNLDTDSMTAFEEGVEWADEHPNGSVIHWQMGEPEFEGEYLVTYQYREDFTRVCTTLYYSLGVWRNKDWDEVPSKRIIAWCKLSDIEPYKEETK